MNQAIKHTLLVARRSVRDLPDTIRGLRSINLLLILFGLLTLATWWVGDADWQYSAGEELAFEVRFPGAGSDWSISGPEGSMLLDDRSLLLAGVGLEEQSRARKRFELPGTRSSWQRSLPDRIWRRVFGNNRLLRVRSSVETLKSPGKLEGRARHARIAAWLVDEDKSSKPFRYATVANLQGSQPRYSVDTVLSVPKKTDSIDLVFMSLESTGHFRMRHLEARLVKRTLLYKTALTLGIAAWLGLLAAFAITFIKRVGWALTGLIALSLSAIVVGVMLPETVRLEPLRRLFAMMTSGVGDEDGASFVLVYKAGHFIFFTLATFIVLMNRWRLGVRRWQVLVFFVLLAIATEGLQLHLFDRSTRGTDLLVDIAGVAVAFLLALVLAQFGVHGRRERRRRPDSPSEPETIEEGATAVALQFSDGDSIVHEDERVNVEPSIAVSEHEHEHEHGYEHGHEHGFEHKHGHIEEHSSLEAEAGSQYGSLPEDDEFADVDSVIAANEPTEHGSSIKAEEFADIDAVIAADEGKEYSSNVEADDFADVDAAITADELAEQESSIADDEFAKYDSGLEIAQRSDSMSNIEAPSLTAELENAKPADAPDIDALHDRVGLDQAAHDQPAHDHAAHDDVAHDDGEHTDDLDELWDLDSLEEVEAAQSREAPAVENRGARAVESREASIPRAAKSEAKPAVNKGEQSLLDRHIDFVLDDPEQTVTEAETAEEQAVGSSFEAGSSEDSSAPSNSTSTAGAAMGDDINLVSTKSVRRRIRKRRRRRSRQ